MIRGFTLQVNGVVLLAITTIFTGGLTLGQTTETGAGAVPFVLEAAAEMTTPRPSISLDGEWDFSYDPKNVGEQEQWFLPTAAALNEKTMVPGCVQAANHPSAGMSEADYAEFHKKQGEFMMDVRWPTLAASWQRKQFTVPADWREKDVWLHFGGLNPAADIWLNGTRLGSTVTSRCPVRVNITPLVHFGGENVVVVKLHWTDAPRLDGVFTFFSAFSGLYRSVRVEAVPRVYFKDLHVVGRIAPRRALVNFTVAGLEQQSRQFRATCVISGQGGQQEFQAERLVSAATLGESGDVIQQVEIDMPEAKLWSYDEPNLYSASVTLYDGQKPCDSATVSFGLRELRIEGLRVLLNGKPVFLRAACDIHVYPETISPPASKEVFASRIRTAKRFGFNCTKNCMEIYTQEYLDAADELGFLVCQEMPFGLTGKYRTTIREKMPQEYVALYRRELANIVRSDRAHPSVVLYSTISEFSIGGMQDHAFKLFCQELPAAAKRLNPQALVIDITCACDWRKTTKRGPRVTDFIEETANYQYTQEPLSHPIEGEYEKLELPFLLHEYNWWTSLPEISLKGRYASLPYKLNGVPELERSAAEAGLSDQVPTFVDRSRRLKHQLQKCGLELARRNPKISGYNFFLFSGLSWCQEGMLNEFLDEPDDITAEEIRMYTGDTAVLLDDGNRRDFECGKPAALGIEVSHFGPQELDKPTIFWQLVDKEKVVSEGTVTCEPIACGSLTAAKPLAIAMPPGPDPALLQLLVRLVNGEREVCRNQWKLWALPAPEGGPWTSRIATDLPFVAKAYQVGQLAVPLNADSLKLPVVATGRLNPTLIDYMRQGGKVVLFSSNALRECRPGVEFRPGQKVANDWTAMCDIYRSAPWNAGAWGNMGTVIADHPALGKLPHEGWCDLNFVHLIHGVFPILTENLRPPQIDPIIRSIGHKNTMIDRAYLFEVKVGRGALLATSLKLADTYASHPQTRYLVESLLSYACSDQCQPKAEVAVDKLLAAAVPTVAEVAAKLEAGQEPVRIVCLGDSVTGVYYHTGGRRAWPEMLRIALQKTYPQAKVEVFNAGISGNTGGEGLARIERDVLAHKPHLVAVMFGLNDIVRGDRNTYRENLKSIIGRCRESGAAVVLCTLNSVYPNPSVPQAAVAEYSQIVRDVAQECGVPAADCLRAYEAVRAQNASEWTLLMSETIHPSMTGHKLFAATVAEAISGKPVSLADVPPPADSLQFTLARLKAGQPVSVIAMPPYDDIMRSVFLELFPRAQIDVTPWPVEGQSLAAMMEWSKRIRDQKPNLVVLAVPAGAQATDEESFIRTYFWLLSWSVQFDRAAWDLLPVLPGVTAPVAPSEERRAELARRIITGGDVECVERKQGDTRGAREILLEWFRQRQAQGP